LKERERESKRLTDKETDRQRDRQTKRPTDKETDRQMRHTDKDTEREKQKQTYLNVALSSNNSIHRCLSKRVKCFVKPPHEFRLQELKKERQTHIQWDKQTEEQKQTYLNIALGCNNSIHRCLSKRVKSLSNLLMNKRRKECFKEIERQTDRKTVRCYTWTLH
jgi:hypothetical protein